jgi:alkanesulfonate monooxygenase SsuD/methylene tetrahydromethanopterin reductase-like flavin-dependent oxidoreductase (luciferase family)
MHLCGVTWNIRIGCRFNIVPMWHPLRLAEDYAMADILTGGRVIFGVGREYLTASRRLLLFTKGDRSRSES